MMAYESDHTVFMREWLEKNPQELVQKKSGRALWWDKEPQDEDARARLAAARVPRKAYYYDAN
jgi:hypothetical protein